ncbi:hypothetical protein [Sphingobacterium sp.]|uniref:hypothetical protein n=1 Tax=Sphingobacterium sp. TaxID=341027 RepID=UPI0028B17AB0|nr:hypothetical protein [Sphingobacterium sp.]
MNSKNNQEKHKLGLIIAFSIIQDPEDNKNAQNNEPEYQNPFYDPDSDQGAQEKNPKEDPLKDDNEPIGEEYPLKENPDPEEEEEEEEEEEVQENDLFNDDDDELDSDTGDFSTRLF